MRKVRENAITGWGFPPFLVLSRCDCGGWGCLCVAFGINLSSSRVTLLEFAQKTRIFVGLKKFIQYQRKTKSGDFSTLGVGL
jgi:hypothetical protein